MAVPRIAIIIPAYNEGASVGTVIRNLRKALERHKWNVQIVVVDDGSDDDTARKADQAGAYVIRHIINTGTGGATATGLRYAEQQGFTIAATIDADGQHHASDVIKGLKLMLGGGGDLLIGSRLINSGGMSKVKIFGNKGLSLTTRLLFGVRVTDSQSGLRIFSQNALKQLRWKAHGYAFCSEMLWRAKHNGLTINEFPIRAIYTEYSMAKGQNNWNAVHIVRSLLARRLMELFGE